MWQSATLAALAATEWTWPCFASTPMCAFRPKYHCLPFLVWCISGSRSPLAFLVDEGACRMVASTIGASFSGFLSDIRTGLTGIEDAICHVVKAQSHAAFLKKRTRNDKQL